MREQRGETPCEIHVENRNEDNKDRWEVKQLPEIEAYSVGG